MHHTSKKRVLLALQGSSEYMRPLAAAHHLSICIRTLRAWTRAGVIPHYRPGGGRVILYSRGDLDKALGRIREGLT